MDHFSSIVRYVRAYWGYVKRSFIEFFTGENFSTSEVEPELGGISELEEEGKVKDFFNGFDKIFFEKPRFLENHFVTDILKGGIYSNKAVFSGCSPTFAINSPRVSLFSPKFVIRHFCARIASPLFRLNSPVIRFFSPIFCILSRYEHYLSDIYELSSKRVENFVSQISQIRFLLEDPDSLQNWLVKRSKNNTNSRGVDDYNSVTYWEQWLSQRFPNGFPLPQEFQKHYDALLEQSISEYNNGTRNYKEWEELKKICDDIAQKNKSTIQKWKAFVSNLKSSTRSDARPTNHKLWYKSAQKAFVQAIENVYGINAVSQWRSCWEHWQEQYTADVAAKLPLAAVGHSSGSNGGFAIPKKVLAAKEKAKSLHKTIPCDPSLDKKVDCSQVRKPRKQPKVDELPEEVDSVRSCTSSAKPPRKITSITRNLRDTKSLPSLRAKSKPHKTKNKTISNRCNSFGVEDELPSSLRVRGEPNNDNSKPSSLNRKTHSSAANTKAKQIIEETQQFKDTARPVELHKLHSGKTCYLRINLLGRQQGESPLRKVRDCSVTLKEISKVNCRIDDLTGRMIPAPDD